MPKLTPKQEAFCREYLVDLNATQAAIRAGYAKNTANRTGPRLLTNAVIQERVQKLMIKREKKTEITADRVLNEIAAIAFTNIVEVVDPETGGISAGADRDKLRAVSSIKVKPTMAGVEREVKMADKLRALEMLCRHLGLNAVAKDDEGQVGGIVEIPAVAELPDNVSGGGGDGS